MREDIYNFPKQLLFSPIIENKEKWKNFENYLLAGMGGSHLQGDIFLSIFKETQLTIHSDYKLPRVSQNTGIITASYSGNTEEVVDVFKESVSSETFVSVIAKEGYLIEEAKRKNIPYIQLPQENIQPRVAIGYSFKALLEMMGIKKDFEKVVKSLFSRMDDLEKEGEKIASLSEGKIPIIYSSNRNCALSKIWKINFNETAKIPSFYNTVPELNHNEMTGFDVSSLTKKISENMIFILLTDKEDNPRNQKRMSVLKKVLEKREFEVLELPVEGDQREEKVFSSIILSMWSSYYGASLYNNDPREVPMVEEFKKMIT